MPIPRHAIMISAIFQETGAGSMEPDIASACHLSYATQDNNATSFAWNNQNLALSWRDCCSKSKLVRNVSTNDLENINAALANNVLVDEEHYSKQ